MRLEERGQDGLAFHVLGFAGAYLGEDLVFGADRLEAAVFHQHGVGVHGVFFHGDDVRVIINFPHVAS